MGIAVQSQQDTPSTDGNAGTQRVVREMFVRVMTVAQLLHSHEQTLPSHRETAEKVVEKTQDVHAVVS